jgi:hypothetical protein
MSDAGNAAACVIINGKQLSPAQLQELAANYGAAPPPGRYWYDMQSGLWGVEGREACGFIRCGHDLGELSPHASNGSTGIFINGRQINLAEALFYQRMFGAALPGRYWLNGANGNIGMEGSALPLGNLAAAIQQSMAPKPSGGGHQSVLSTWDRTGVAVF